MLRYTILFLVLALVASLFGFEVISSTFVDMAKILFFVFLVLFVVTLVLGRRPPASR